MDIKVQYNDIKKRYPTFVHQAYESLHNSKSKHKNDPQEDLNWKIVWYIVGISYTYGDLILKKIPVKRKRFCESYNESNYENVKIYIDNNIDIMWHIQCSKGHGSGNSEHFYINIPKEIIDLYVIQFQKEIDEYNRVQSLSELEKQKEKDNILKELRKDKGFVEVYIKKNE
jgi:hypothetical protein